MLWKMSMLVLILLVQLCICLGSIRLQSQSRQHALNMADQSQTGASGLVVTFGFNALSGSMISKQLFGELDRKTSVVIDISEPSGLLRLYGKECVIVGYLSTIEQEAGCTQFLKFMQTYVGSVIANEKKKASVVIVLEGRPDAKSDRLKQLVDELVSEALLFGRSLEIKYQHVVVGDEEAIAEARDAISSILTTASKQQRSPVSAKEVRSLLQEAQAVSTQTIHNNFKDKGKWVSSDTLRDTESSQVLVDDFVSRLNSSIHELLEGGLVSAGATVNTTMQALNSTLVEVDEAHAAAHGAELARLRNSPILQAASLQCRQRMVHLLLPVHRNILQSMLQGSMEAFDKRAARLTGVTKLPKLMSLLSAATSQGFSQSLDKVQQDFLSMLRMTSAEGLLGNVGSSGSSAVDNAVSGWKSCFSAGLERRRLQEYMQHRSAERVNALFLAGSYNPYVRDSPLPPIHLNLNYLLDPTAAKLAWEYRRLYDEHRDGPCVTRADPLIFPGVAAIPFDPNSHPVPTEKGTNWVTLVKDFFTKE